MFDLKKKLSKISLTSRRSDSDDSNFPEVPENIRAFRTITTMLSLIHHGTTFSDSSLKSTDSLQRQELKLLNALATIVVRDVEVVAAVVNHDPDRRGALEVIVHCTHLTDDAKELTPQSEDPQGRKRTLVSTSDVPIIVNPEDKVPPDLKKNSDIRLLEDYIRGHMHKETFETHIWILSKLLLESKKRVTPLQRYVVAADFPKILRRLQHSTLSKPMFDSLKSISSFDFVELSEINPRAAEIGSDRILLCEVLPPLHPFLVTQIPNLLQQGRAATSTAGGPCEVYTADTCKEFHQLLCELIEKFKRSLEQFQDWENPPKDAKNPSKDSEKSSKESFDKHLNSVMVFGDALLWIVRGSAIRKHLRVIESLLDDRRRDKAAVVKLEIVTKENQKEEEEEEEEEDTELRRVQPYTIFDGIAPQPLWKSYMDWLMILVVHFDAVSILAGYIRDPKFMYNEISIKILSPPRVSDAMLPWEDLLRSTHFPQFTREETDKVIEFFNKWTAANNASGGTPVEEVIKAAKLLNAGGNVNRADAVERIARQVSNLKNCKSPGWEEYVQDVVLEIEKLKKDCTSPDSHASIHRIIGRLESLRDHAKLFNKLRKDPLVMGKGFTGTQHCEISIATLIDLLRTISASGPNYDKYKDILDELKNTGPVIGVSKRCCPVCQQLLNILATYASASGSTTPFIVRGSHSIITACTLPTWLPDDIVDRMNRQFGLQLRQELVEIMERPTLSQSRAQSTDSQRLSLESLERGCIVVLDNRMAVYGSMNRVD